MARFYGAVGYGMAEETRPGVWEDKISERNYYGDVERVSRQLREAEKLNSDINLSMSISIVADAFANEHIFAIRYVRWSGGLWTIRNVEIKAPRLILHIGGVYNGQTAPTPVTP